MVALLQSSRNDRICDGADIPGSALLARIAFDGQCRKSPDGNPLYFDIVGLVLAAACAVEKPKAIFAAIGKIRHGQSARAEAPQTMNDKIVGCHVVVEAGRPAGKRRLTS
jgi:hypothetical protein